MLLAAVWASPAEAQSTLERTPNLSGGWVGTPGVVNFNFTHRFHNGRAPARRVGNAPTFLLAYPPATGLLFGLQYATNSGTAAGIPNEWEAFGRLGLLRQAEGGPLDLALQGGYNLAAESFDGALEAAREAGPLRILATARAFSDGYADGSARGALGAGAAFRVGPAILAADAVTLLDRGEGEDVAWGAGVQFQLPTTPHTLSLHATNVNTTTLQGSSRGSGRVRYGFEFTVPITLRRYFRTSPPAAAMPETTETAAATPETTERAAATPDTAERAAATPETRERPAVVSDTVVIRIRDFRYQPQSVTVAPGTVVRWVNEDPLIHTATADAQGGWDSGELASGQSWTVRFERAGRHTYHCTPHPFMTGAVVVR